MATLTTAVTVSAQPAFDAPAPSGEVMADASLRRAAYLQRVNEVLEWKAGDRRVATDDPANLDMATIATKLALGQDVEQCSARVI